MCTQCLQIPIDTSRRAYHLNHLNRGHRLPKLDRVLLPRPALASLGILLERCPGQVTSNVYVLFPDQAESVSSFGPPASCLFLRASSLLSSPLPHLNLLEIPPHLVVELGEPIRDPELKVAPRSEHRKERTEQRRPQETTTYVVRQIHLPLPPRNWREPAGGVTSRPPVAKRQEQKKRNRTFLRLVPLHGRHKNSTVKEKNGRQAGSRTTQIHDSR